MFFRKLNSVVIGEWVNFGSDECTKHHWHENNLAIISSYFEACGIQIFHLHEVYAMDWSWILARMKKSIAMTLLHFKIFSVHALLLNRKFQLVCPYVGHIWIALWVSGSTGSTGTPFNPDLCIICSLSYLFTNFITVIEFISAIYDDSKNNWFVVNIYVCIWLPLTIWWILLIYVENFVICLSLSHFIDDWPLSFSFDALVRNCKCDMFVYMCMCLGVSVFSILFISNS